MSDKLPTKKELNTFLELCEPFIKTQRRIEKDKYGEKGDLSVLYRLLTDLSVWKWLHDNKEDEVEVDE